MTLLPRTEDICDFVLGSIPNTQIRLVSRRVVAAALVWALNLAIQPLQMGLRALICETCPPGKDTQAAAYASTMTCIGNVVGYSMGYLDLPRLAPVLGDIQFKALVMLAACSLSITTAITLLTANEKPLLHTRLTNSKPPKAMQNLRYIFDSVRYLPEDIKMIFRVQFFAWLAWFPFLYYIATYALHCSRLQDCEG